VVKFSSQVEKYARQNAIIFPGFGVKGDVSNNQPFFCLVSTEFDLVWDLHQSVFVEKMYGMFRHLFCITCCM